MASKWINKDLFTKFQEQKKQEQDNIPNNSGNRLEKVWKNPDRGTVDKPKIYEGRFLQDTAGNFYEKYFYHMFNSNEKWCFVLCEKTFDMSNFCPWCTTSSKLYMSGNKADKDMARNYKRKERYCGNWYIVDDPRDVETDDEERKSNGKVKIYEFPSKVESKVKNEVTDSKNGLGPDIFDPGKDGYNFIIKVKATKPTADGKIFPDYADSIFSRRPTPLGTDIEIKKIMEQTINLKEYIRSMKMDDDNNETLLKSEMVWDIVSNEWNENRRKVTRTTVSEDVSDESVVDNDSNDNNFTNTSTESTDQSDEDLLKELEDL